jgi:hypothetical protein
MEFNNVFNLFINNIANLLRGLEQTLGLPLWAVITFLISCLILLFFYGLYVPISMIRLKNNLNDIKYFLRNSRLKA